MDSAEVVAGSDHWAGVIPLRTVAGAPEAAPDLRRGVPVPAHVAGYSRLPRWRPAGGHSRLLVVGECVLMTVVSVVVCSVLFVLFVAALERRDVLAWLEGRTALPGV